MELAFFERPKPLVSDERLAAALEGGVVDEEGSTVERGGQSRSQSSEAIS